MGESVGTTSTPASTAAMNTNSSANTASEERDVAAMRNDIDNIKQRGERSKQLAAAAREKQQAEASGAANNNAAGKMQKKQGAVQVGIGSATAMLGFVILAKTPFDLTTTTTITALGFIISGAGQQANGAIMIKQGNQMIDKGTEMLAEAAELGLISKQEASAANKEMIRAQLMKSKLQMKELALDQVKTMNNSLADDQKLSEDQLQAVGSDLGKFYDKAFKAGAQTLQNGGITTLETENGDNRYFIRDPKNEGAITEISIQTDENGEAVLDEHGRLQIDENLDVFSEENKLGLTENDHAQLVLNMSVAEGMEGMILGDADEDIPPLARIQIDEVTGSISKGQFNLNDPEQMREFAMIAETLDQQPPPLHFFEDEETGDLYFQEWNWDTNTETGEKISIKDMAGGENADKALAQATFAKTGLQEGGSRYQVLEHIVNYAQESDNNGLPDFSDYQSFILGGRPTIGSSANSNSDSSILDEQVVDDVEEGHA